MPGALLREAPSWEAGPVSRTEGQLAAGYLDFSSS